ncbi:metallophosphoesterase [Alphaproteobacteria bacterium]|nr:metallophosphoesterase [Alphaproteobacteria bacterium]
MNKRPSGEILFDVALVSDTHVNEKEDFSTSPYPANGEANPRARYVFQQINHGNAQFCIHLGDMVNPVPELPSYVDAADNFHQLAAELTMPLHLMPGNHDIGDKPVTWMPAGMVNSEHISLYRKHFGSDYFSFDHENCHFVIINSPLINSGDPAEKEQAHWLEADLASNTEKRIFLFSHYPVYVSDPSEPESYDNIDEPGRSWLLNLIDQHKPEALFSAHVHNFWYDLIGETEYYIVPSTCFVRHDYSEMYRIDGGSQQGRNDGAKLGHVTLKIYEHGHVAHYHRSYAECSKEGGPSAPPVVLRPHVKTTNIKNIFVDMRHAWTEELNVAPSGAVDEFRRKKARNDYPVMALWEMGLRGLRVPLQDLMDTATRRRMEIMFGVGHKFHIYRYGIPTKIEIETIKKHFSKIEKLELVLGWEAIHEQVAEIQCLKDETRLPIVLSRVNRNDASKTSGGKYNHLISHGFTIAEIPEIESFIRKNPLLLDGVQFTIPRSVNPWNAGRELLAFKNDTDCKPILYVKSTEASPAQRFDDEIDNAIRFSEAVLSGIAFDIDIILDTFDDADRGYFTRTGLIDRRFNPRISGQLVSELIRQLDQSKWSAADSESAEVIDDKGNTVKIGTTSEITRGSEWHDPQTGLSGDAASISEVASNLVVIKSRT